MSRGVGVWSGKVNLSKIITYHEREAWLGSYTENEKRAKFHNDVVQFLKKLQDNISKD